MAQIINNIQNVANQGFTFDEYVEDWYPGDGVFVPGEAGVTVIFNIPFSDIKKALLALLGWSVRRGATLHREPPLQHPIFPWMYCSKITKYQPYQFDGAGSPNKSGGNFPTQIPLYAGYNFVRIGAQFNPLPYKVLSDQQILVKANPGDAGTPDEFKRYNIQNFKPRGEAIQLDRGTLTYKAVAAAPPDPGVPANIPLSLGYSRRVIKTDIFWNWQQVPEDGWFSQGGIYPPWNQVLLLGTTNNASFQGYPANTLLLQDIEATPKNFGMESDFSTVTGSRYFDVKFTATYFSPYPTAQGQNPPQLGDWNSVPYVDGTWRTAQFGDGTSLYPSGDWTKLFQVNQ